MPTRSRPLRPCHSSTAPRLAAVLIAVLATLDTARAADATVSTDPGFGESVGASLSLPSWRDALWPADIARLSAQHLAADPQAADAALAREAGQAAARTAALLQESDARLFRPAFEPRAGEPPLPPEVRTDRRRAALGDAQAAARLAADLPRQSPRRLGWLQLAAALGHAPSAYALALYHRTADQPQLAAWHEAQALALGHVPPPALDHHRK